MFRPAISVFMATIVASLTCSSANAQPPAFAVAPRALCITDPYGTSYCHWYGSPVAFNSYFNYSPNGTNSFGYSFTSTGYYWSGVPSVASAATPEWTVQRTSVLLTNPYLPQRPYATPWQMPIGTNTDSQTNGEVLQAGSTASFKMDRVVQQQSARSGPTEETASTHQAAGDRLVREGLFAEAYLQYLKAERSSDNIQTLSIREALTLVLMQRHAHAAAKLKRGLTSRSEAITPAIELEQALGAAFHSRLAAAIESSDQWLSSNPKDPDRQFLTGFLKYLNTDSQAAEHLDAARNQAGSADHLVALQRMIDERSHSRE